jgi:hypothetical protein
MQNPPADIIIKKIVDATKKFVQEFKNYESFETFIKSAEEIALKPGH